MVAAMQPAAPLVSVVDDDLDVRTALARLISSAGLVVETFASGAEFMRSVDDHEPNCVVLDLHMAGMSGFDVQGRLAAEHAALPVVIITGHDSPQSCQRALRLGAKAYLCKPVDGEALLSAIGAAISPAASGPDNP
jgi:FixJ family two-component response regulator